jgi:hypothetical protein
MRRTSILQLAGILIAAGIGCGNTSNPAVPDGSTNTPASHALDNGTYQVTKNYRGHVGPYTLPEGATITYTITDMPKGAPDMMDVLVVSDDMIMLPSYIGYGVRAGVSSVTATTEPLPADTYDLAFFCNNTAVDCVLGYMLTASY